MKFKKITDEYCNFICDKLTRFKPARIRLKTLFNDIIAKFYSDNNISALNELQRAEIAVEVINSSFEKNEFDDLFNQIFLELENKSFVHDEISFNYLKKRINITSIINRVQISEKTPKNVFWLKKILDLKCFNLVDLREKYSLMYPLEGVILCEGQTEFTLLETIFCLYNIDISKLGLMIIPAGGKNQVARKYYELIEYLKLPICILLDNDAVEVKKLIDTKLRNVDKLYLIKSGEFEDLIPKKILMNTINTVHNNDYTCNFDDFEDDIPRSHNLELIYKKYGYGEFKKAQFAKELNEYISKNCSKTDFCDSEINQIVSFLFNK